MPRTPTSTGRMGRCWRTSSASSTTIRSTGIRHVPLAVAEAAAEVAVLAALVAQEGNDRLRGDAFVAAELAGGGARGAAELVAINLAGLDDPRVRRAQDLAAATARFTQRSGTTR